MPGSRPQTLLAIARSEARILFGSTLLAQETIQLGINLSFSGIIALIAGIAILVQPRLLNNIVAIYLIIVGLIQIFNIGA